jgi:hypothetical protein
MDEETASAQALIHANQNPENCSTARYLVWRVHNYGIGAEMHNVGGALGVAMAYNRVLIYDTRA